MRKILIPLLMLGWVTAAAQNNNTDFRSFREGLMNDFQAYRKKVLDDYANYLGGVWKEFRSFREEKRDVTPKPTVAPKADPVATRPVPKATPKPVVRPAQPKAPAETPKTPDEAPKKPAIPAPVRPTLPPTLHPQPVAPARPQVPTMDFAFYGLTIRSIPMPVVELSSIENKEVAAAWKQYQEEPTDDIIASLQATAASLGLNDWFRFELVRQYVDALMPRHGPSERILLQHFLLANLEYDVRLAKSDSQLLLLVPFSQLVYGRKYLVLDNVRYYSYYDNIAPIADADNYLYTCELPAEVDKGNRVNLVFDRYAMNIPCEEQQERTVTDGKIKVSEKVNTALQEMLRRYPQMDIPHYAASDVVPQLHQNILAQIGPQVATLPQLEAVNALLHFVQYAFDYATDGDQHGYEKPYFIEENFYYPQNDCEDRSILFAFLVRELLGLDVHLIQYPGHECTAIHFTTADVVGTSYLYEGKAFHICDPTYLGAVAGQCMPNYEAEDPTIELW
jgi:hypothetical protein